MSLFTDFWTMSNIKYDFRFYMDYILLFSLLFFMLHVQIILLLLGFDFFFILATVFMATPSSVL